MFIFVCLKCISTCFPAFPAPALVFSLRHSYISASLSPCLFLPPSTPSLPLKIKAGRITISIDLVPSKNAPFLMSHQRFPANLDGSSDLQHENLNQGLQSILCSKFCWQYFHPHPTPPSLCSVAVHSA